MSDKERIILGIDPGTTIMGYGLIKCHGKKMEMLAFGTIMLSKYRDQMLKLKHIFERTLQLVEEYKPDELAIESQFFGKNVQSMLKLGRAQGIAIAAALYRDIPIYELAPKRIKQAITGNGNASKEQVASMLVRMLNIEIPEHLDATDGLAAAVAHFFQSQGEQNAVIEKKFNSWDAFIKNNPGRVK